MTKLKPAPDRGDGPPAVAALMHELTEALTATGNYLTAATRMLDANVDPPDVTLRDVLEKSLVQFSRSVEILRQLCEPLHEAAVQDAMGKAQPATSPGTSLDRKIAYRLLPE